MIKDEMKNKCAERAKIFQQSMESCKSSNPIDCIEWFADKIEELEKENERLHDFLTEAMPCECCKHYDEDLEKEDKEPCKNCFFDNSYWELKED